MCCKKRVVTRRTWYLFIAGIFSLGAAGIGLIVYGTQILPNQLPPDLVPPVTYGPNGQITSGSAYSTALTRYQVQTDAFKFVIAGVSAAAGAFLLILLFSCRYELPLEHVSLRVVPAPV